MNDPLHNLLKRADETYWSSSSSTTTTPRRIDLPRRVYRRHRRNQAIRSGAIVAMLLSVALVGFVLQRVDQPQVVRREDQSSPVSQGDAQFTSLSADADVHSRTADLLCASERRRDGLEKSLESLSRTDPRDEIREQKNQFALTRVSEADRLAEHPQRANDAMKIYQRTIELFPDTPAADIAARRLEQLPRSEVSHLKTQV